MNLVGHLVAAEGAGHTLPVQLGAVLPDALHLIGARTPPLLTDALAEGVAIHHRTDEVFHRDPWVVAEMAALRDRLVGIGLERGPARAASHIAWEMLLDGVLVGAGRASSWPSAWRHADEVLPALGAEFHPDWRDLQRHTASMDWPRSYQEPGWVAERVVRICARRPRLALGMEPAAVARVLEPPDPTAAMALLARVVDHLSA